jgi:outer membrane biosynthesis protein TonB
MHVSMPSLRRPLLASALGLLACAAFACGGGGKPAQTSGTSTVATTTAGGASTESAPPKPKRESRYPAPFQEPSCAEPQPEGIFEGGKAAVQEVKQKNWERLQRCIQDLPEDAEIRGQINVKFRLDPDGVPRCVEATGGTAVDEEVVRCVLATYRTFAYPKPRSGSKWITDSLRFETTEDD